jgi:uncharacterized damage-inducible protein DinB
VIQQTPWFERKFDFNYPIGLFPVIVERLRGTVSRIELITKGIDEEKATHKPDGKWSVKEIIGHLYDLEELWMARIEDFLAKKEILHAADLNNEKTKKAGHDSKTIAELIRQFKEAREKLLQRVENLDESRASVSALHPRLQKPMRLVDSLYFVAEHDDQELAKMRSLI